MNGSSFASIEEAVLCFYQSNHVLQGEAQKCLTELQNSPQIWDIIWDELLLNEVSRITKFNVTNYS